MPDAEQLADLVVQELADALPTEAEEHAMAELEAVGFETIYVAEEETLRRVVTMALEKLTEGGR